MTLYLHGLGHFHPEVEITNRFLEELDIGTNDQWILERVGIKTRRTMMPLEYIKETKNKNPAGALEAALYSNADIGQRAAEMALARSGVRKDEIGMLICGTSAADYASPAEGCSVARALELEVPAFDVISACTSLFVALHLLNNMQEGALPPYVLAVAPEGLTRTVDYSDRAAAVLWGDAAVAMVLSTRIPSRVRILGNFVESSPAGADKVIVPRFGHFAQEGRTVQTFAIKKTIWGVKKLEEALRRPERNFNFVGHQANLRMLESVCKYCDIPKERHHFNVEDYGNTGAASAASVVSMRWDQWTDLDDVAIVGVGSGLTWSGYVIRFGAGAPA